MRLTSTLICMTNTCREYRTYAYISLCAAHMSGLGVSPVSASRSKSEESVMSEISLKISEIARSILGRYSLLGM